MNSYKSQQSSERFWRLNSVFQRSEVRNKVEFTMDLRQTSKYFLSAAVRIERLLTRPEKASRGVLELETLERGLADTQV